ncbi:uncharacterized protein LOC135391858 isoform X2 [Ornithodoros turicata]|uniref:uncharacterized protein LOC135391858 isoform X2 n=1 Tax=Ornithodoros turicata TaxID=34597 RepID=UPI003139E2AE
MLSRLDEGRAEISTEVLQRKLEIDAQNGIHHHFITPLNSNAVNYTTNILQTGIIGLHTSALIYCNNDDSQFAMRHAGSGKIYAGFGVKRNPAGELQWFSFTPGGSGSEDFNTFSELPKKGEYFFLEVMFPSGNTVEVNKISTVDRVIFPPSSDVRFMELHWMVPDNQLPVLFKNKRPCVHSSAKLYVGSTCVIKGNYAENDSSKRGKIEMKVNQQVVTFPAPSQEQTVLWKFHIRGADAITANGDTAFIARKDLPQDAYVIRPTKNLQVTSVTADANTFRPWK